MMLARLPSSLNHIIHRPELEHDINMNMNEFAGDRPGSRLSADELPSGGSPSITHLPRVLTGRSSLFPVNCGRCRWDRILGLQVLRRRAALVIPGLTRSQAAQAA